MPSASISLILPAYNEILSIARTIEEARAYFDRAGRPFEIIVSADGTDGTRELVADMAKQDPRLKVTGAARRRGKGYGIRRGVKMAQGDIIGYMDADNKTPIAEFVKIEPLLQEGYDIVIGSRKRPDARIERPQPLHRRLGAKGFGFLARALLGLARISDTQCGFKFFQRRVAFDLFGRQRIDGYMFDVEILYLAQQAGYRIAEVPVRWRDDGDSRLELLNGNIRNAIDLLRVRFAKPQKHGPAADAYGEQRRPARI